MGSDPGLRLMLYDATCAGRVLPGLSASWRWGGRLYRGLGRIDASFGATTWEEGLDWLARFEPSRRITELQYWGHGQPGRVLLDRHALGTAAFDRAHPLHARLAAIRDRLAGRDALLWFRTCSLFRGADGHDFARVASRFFDARVAGHTFVIGPVQGGLHSLAPGAEPTWSLDEGAPTRRRIPEWLDFSHPQAITCLHGRVPDGY